jgi:integrase
LICSKCKTTINDSFVYCPHCGKKQAQTAAPKPHKRANGQGSVYKVSGRRAKPWAVTRNKVLLGYCATKTEGYELLEKTKNVDMSSYSITLGQVFEMWKEPHFKKITPSTIKDYTLAWTRLSALESRRMRDIKTHEIQKIIDNAISANGKPLSLSAKKKISLLANQLFDFAMQNDIVDKNYAEYITHQKEEAKVKKIFTYEDIQKFTVDNSQASQIVLVLIYTGFRINELFSAKTKDVNLELGYIVGGEKTEKGKNRVIPIHPAILPIIKNWISQGGEYLVKNTEGGKMDDCHFRRRDFYPLLDRLGIERKTLHDTRRTFATMAAASGMRPEVMQKIIGHVDYSTTTDYYIATYIEDLSKAMSQIK